MNHVGQNIHISFFGESHGHKMGVTIDGLPPGITLNIDLIKNNLKQRQPKRDSETSRVESDAFEIISGYHQDHTTGAPLTFIIENKAMNSSDYPNLNEIPRPSHADLPAYIKYHGFNDYHGGGMFSGRLTVLWVIVGSIAQQILENKHIYVGSHIRSIHHIENQSFKDVDINKNQIKALQEQEIPLLNSNQKEKIIKLIQDTKNDHDSLGGIIESAIIGLPIGIGQPIIHTVEGYLSYLLFSIPSIKGVSFGSGFDITKLYGSEANDEYFYENGQIKTKTNHNGGILGGLTTGQPIIIQSAIKPIASIAKKQKTIHTKKKENTEILISGRHDAQILTRISPVINAVLNFGILDLLYKDIQV